MARIVPYAAIQFAAFEQLKIVLTPENRYRKQVLSSTPENRFFQVQERRGEREGEGEEMERERVLEVGAREGYGWYCWFDT